jgi:hypothetical protein
MGASDFGQAIMKKLTLLDKIVSHEAYDFSILLRYQEKAL